MSSTETVSSNPQVAEPVSPDNKVQEPEVSVKSTQEYIDQARRNIAEGHVLVSDSVGVVETPREAEAVARGETDSK